MSAPQICDAKLFLLFIGHWLSYLICACRPKLCLRFFAYRLTHLALSRISDLFPGFLRVTPTPTSLRNLRFSFFGMTKAFSTLVAYGEVCQNPASIEGPTVFRNVLRFDTNGIFL